MPNEPFLSRENRIAITGVSRGLGRAMVDKFIELGHVVAGCSRDPQAIADLTRHYRPPHTFDTVDVGDHQQVERWANSLIQAGHVPDLLINNAAIINPNSNLWQVPPEQFHNLLRVNVAGTFHTIREFLPAMIERKRGLIVNVSSGWGRTVSAEVVPYCTTKWAIEALSLGLAEELPRGVAVVSLNPGIINTDMLQSCFAEAADSYPDPQAWAAAAVPFIQQMSVKDNGRQLTVPL
ncbi:MAG: SDR family oxidoreductase [Planctomycetales bacterium]|nr:SDR family oxidoreductase [Planctomycetales bacterium]